MAPINSDIDAVEQNIKDVIHGLFQMMVQVSTYDSAGKPSRDVLGNELLKLSHALQQVHASAQALPRVADARVPAPLIMYVEHGRNPDIYTREFVEMVRRMNQLMRGKMLAFRGFRDVLARELAAANPELAPDVARVVAATGGNTGGHGAGDSTGSGTGGVGGAGGSGSGSGGAGEGAGESAGESAGAGGGSGLQQQGQGQGQGQGQA